MHSTAGDLHGHILSYYWSFSVSNFADFVDIHAFGGCGKDKVVSRSATESEGCQSLPV